MIADTMKREIDETLALRMLAVIQRHLEGDPITGHALAEMFGISLRRTQEEIEKLRATGHKIAANQWPPFGYFLAKTPDQIEPTAAMYEYRGKRHLGTAKLLRQFGDQRTLYEQENVA